MLVAVNDKMGVEEMRQKFRIDFFSAALVATKNGALSPQASCAVQLY